jgi:hypothetical protein
VPVTTLMEPAPGFPLNRTDTTADVVLQFLNLLTVGHYEKMLAEFHCP